jgi:enoyl-CoA hydratase/carnithine racemase
MVGSGGKIAMSCDFIIAASDASFRFPRYIGGEEVYAAPS